MDTKNIGYVLKKAWQESRMPQKEFADKMDMSVRNLQYLFEKNDIHISQLAKASAVLNTDFIKIYLELDKGKTGYDFPTGYNQEQLLNQKQVDNLALFSSTIKNEVNVQLNIKGDFTLMSKYLPEIMNTVKREVENYGLKLA